MALLGMDHIRLDAPALGRLLVLFLLALLVNFFVNLYRVRTLFRNTIKHHDIVSYSTFPPRTSFLTMETDTYSF